MKASRRIALFLMALVATEPALARDRVEAQRERRLEDQGCPAGSYRIVTAPDGSAISVLFDRFVVEGNDANAGFARSSCAMEIPLNLPAGYSLGVWRADYRGYVNLEERQRAELQVEYGVGMRDRSRRFRRDVRGAYEGDYLFSERLNAGFMRRVGCGEPAVLNFRASLTLTSRRGARTGQMALDSVDGAPGGGLVFGLDLRKCRG
jgi:hypothetical protein